MIRYYMGNIFLVAGIAVSGGLALYIIYCYRNIALACIAIIAFFALMPLIFLVSHLISFEKDDSNDNELEKEEDELSKKDKTVNYVQRDIKRYELERKINEARARSYSKMRLQNSMDTTRNPVKKRAGWLNDRMRIPNGFCGPISNIFVLESRKKGEKKLRSYLLVLGKRYKYVEGVGQVTYALEERIIVFDDFLKNNILEGETLTYEHEAFCIKSDEYELDYYIEAYRKQPDKKCYIANGKPEVELLHRSGAARAFYDLKNLVGPHSDIIEDVFREMNDQDHVLLYPNAADRLVALCNKYKKIYRDGLCRISKIDVE